MHARIDANSTIVCGGVRHGAALPGARRWPSRGPCAPPLVPRRLVRVPRRGGVRAWRGGWAGGPGSGGADPVARRHPPGQAWGPGGGRSHAARVS